MSTGTNWPSAESKPLMDAFEKVPNQVLLTNKGVLYESIG